MGLVLTIFHPLTYSVKKVETDAMPSRQVFENKDGALYTTSNGAPVAEPYAVEKLGPIGPLLLQGVC